MIKNAVLHPIGEQPMLVDLLFPPQASDVSLLCTNLRTIDGKRPTSIEDQAGLFIIPLSTIRFIEAAADSVQTVMAAGSAGSARPAKRASSGAAGNGHAQQASNGRAQPADSGHAQQAGNGRSTRDEPLNQGSLVALPGGELHGVLPDFGQDEDAAEDLLRRIRDL